MPTTDWTPTLEDVGAILRARTKDVNGIEVGTFNDDTRPTGTQVTNLIANGLADVSSAVGDDVPMPCQPDARYLAAISVAMWIELSYFPEQVGNNRSPYDRLSQMYDNRLKRLQLCITNTNSGGTTGAASPPAPVGHFPIITYDPRMIGFGTRW